ncbi:SUMO1 sentrin specific peptidase 8 [Vanrija albida]|uniref:SUMO1 sentrin specific peptidase 8 n=1 Tax=Vanrija albida TaxID=181172 RepID=A0ABR3QBS6_9TREE
MRPISTARATSLLHTLSNPRSMSTTTPARRERALPASFYRGGTSKAVIFQRAHLPPDQTQWDPIFLSAIGSPDPNGRQLDGMGGGLSSLSKVVVLDRSSHPHADVDYTFVQVHVRAPVADYGSNCGNMLSAVGPFALEHGLVAPHPLPGGETLVRILNTNTNKIVHASFPVHADAPAEPDLSGEFAIDGVAGTHARITLDFVDPSGSRTGKLFPTGRVVDELRLPGGSIPATLMDCGNPCVYVLASDLGLDPTILPPDLENDRAMLEKLAAIRAAASVRMGLVPNVEAAAGMKSVPKVCIMSAPSTHTVLSGATLGPDSVDVVTRCISADDPHRALPITASLCTAAAAQVPGTLVHGLVSGPRVSNAGIVIGHASGTIEVGADVVQLDSGEWVVPKARVFRTARKLFEGNVYYKV